MKTKSKTLKISISISSISIIILSAFFFLNKYEENTCFEYVYNIALGLFGSSFVVFLITIEEYRVAKTQLLERIWNESIKLNAQLRKIRPIFSYIDNKILVNYINEWLFRHTEEDKRLLGDKHEAYDKIYDYLLKDNRNKIKGMTKEEIKFYIDLLINSEREKTLEKLEKSIDQYLDLNNYSFCEFNNLLGDVKFFTGKKQYLDLYRNIYQPIRNIYDELKGKVCYHFELYRKGEANRPDVLLNIIFENQNKLFEIENEKEEDDEFINIYSKFCDDMDDKIEEFRAKIIYNCEVNKIQHYPIESIHIIRNI